MILCGLLEWEIETNLLITDTHFLLILSYNELLPTVKIIFSTFISICYIHFRNKVTFEKNSKLTDIQGIPFSLKNKPFP